MKLLFRNGTTANLQFSVLLVVLIAIAMPALAQQSSSQNGDAARVLALETLWNQAEVDKDTTALRNLLADNFIFVDVDGSLSQKADFLTSIKNRLERVDSIANDSMATYVYNGAVIVSGTIERRDP